MAPISDSSTPTAVWPERGLLKSKNSRSTRIMVMALVTGLILMNYEAAAQQEAGLSKSGFTCNIDGIPAKDRAHYEQLVESLRHAILERRELPNGYAFRVDTTHVGAGKLVEWVELEKRCCPFFGFELRWERQNGPVWLHLEGTEDIKDFILDEFGLR
jgi:hypothetical protein